MNPLVPFFLALTFGAPWIICRWLRRFGWAARRHRQIRVVLFGASAAHWPTGLLSHSIGAEWAPLPHAVALGVLVTLSVSALPLGARMAFQRFSSQTAKRARAPNVTRRQFVEAGAGAAVFSAAGSALTWGFVRGRHDYRLSEVPIAIPGLPRALDGYVIVQVSDIHAGPFVNEKELDLGLRLVEQGGRPDLICVTGDIVDADVRWTELVARRLAALQSRDGITAVLGNHDHYAGGGQVETTLRAAGIRVLSNDGMVVRQHDGGGFALLGVDDPAAQQQGRAGPDLASALSKVPATLPRILLSHRPATVKRWAGQVALQLSGHTHGGQLYVGATVGRCLFDYVAGQYEVDGTVLYVNRGFGTGGPPTRVGVPPEITRIVLVSA